jgi:polygalacturonase
MEEVNITGFGARDGGVEPATAAIQRAIDNAANRGGGTVVVPAGRFLTGAITLRGNVTLRLEEGSVLLGSQDPADYPLVLTRWEGAEHRAHQSLLFAERADNIAIEGKGTVDGQGDPWWKAQRARTSTHPRPRLIGMHHCRGVRISGVSLLNSPSWTVHPYGCSGVTVSGVRIINPAHSPNTDGVDPESCEDVTIADCFISAGDDCIAIKAGLESSTPPMPCRNIRISGCRMENGHGAVVVGSEMSGGVSDLTVTDCVFAGTDRGFRFKTRRGRGGTIERVCCENVSMSGVGVPVAINMFYKFTGPNGTSAEVQDRNPRPVNGGTPSIRDLSFSRISASDTVCAACFVLGLPEMPVSSLSFSDMHVAMADKAEPFEPEMAVGIESKCRAGFIFTNVSNLALQRVEVTNQVGRDFILENVSHDSAR